MEIRVQLLAFNILRTTQCVSVHCSVSQWEVSIP